MIFDELKLLPGTKLDVRSDQYAALKGASSYIGCLNKKSLIVSAPIANGRPVSCRVGSSLIIRLYVSHLSCASAFRTQIQHTSALPFPHLFLDIPEQVEIGALRKSPRINVNLSGVAKTDLVTKPQPVIINNLSTDGARLQSKLYLGDCGDTVVLSTKMTVLDSEHTVKFTGVIRSAADPNNKDYYGIQFTDLDDRAKLVLYAYVMSEITG